MSLIIKSGECAIPPSVNGLFANVKGKGRVKTAAYTRWRLVAGAQLKSVKAPASGVEVAILVGRCNVQRDLDNMAKPVLDLIKDLGWIVDDSVKHVSSVTVRYLPDDLPASTIRVQVLAPAATAAVGKIDGTTFTGLIVPIGDAA